VSSAHARDYSVFGLVVHSDLPLPELFPNEPQAAADVTIRSGKVPEAAQAREGLSTSDGALVLVIPGVARYRIADGRSITVEPEADVPDRNVRLYLLGSAFGALLHQRGLLPLHANAVDIGGTAIAFMGESGAGKSTLAAAFRDRGYRVIADDVCVVGFDAHGTPYAKPGLPRLRLWAEALEVMGQGTAGFEHSYVADEQLQKFDVPLDPSSAVRSDIPLSGLYLLARADEFSIDPLTGVEAADAVFANTYRGAFVSAANGQESHWQSAVHLVQRLPAFRVSRRWNLALLKEQSRSLLEHARGLNGDLAGPAEQK
jgi:hypothetical protein